MVIVTIQRRLLTLNFISVIWHASVRSLFSSALEMLDQVVYQSWTIIIKQFSSPKQPALTWLLSASAFPGTAPRRLCSQSPSALPGVYSTLPLCWLLHVKDTTRGQMTLLSFWPTLIRDPPTAGDVKYFKVPAVFSEASHEDIRHAVNLAQSHHLQLGEIW